MRRATVITAVLLASLLAVLAGCATGGSSESTSPTTYGTTTTSENATTSTTYTPFGPPPIIPPGLASTTTLAPVVVHAWGETAQGYDLTVTAEAPKEDTKAPLLDKGQKLIYCTVTIVNNGTGPYEYNALYFQLLDAESQPYDAVGYTELPKLVHGFIPPGRIIKGAVAFVLPEDAEAATLIFSPLYPSSDQMIWGK